MVVFPHMMAPFIVGRNRRIHRRYQTGKRDEENRSYQLLDTRPAWRSHFEPSFQIRTEQAREAVVRWPEFAASAGVAEEKVAAIGKTHRRF